MPQLPRHRSGERLLVLVSRTLRDRRKCGKMGIVTPMERALFSDSANAPITSEYHAFTKSVRYMRLLARHRCDNHGAIGACM